MAHILCMTSGLTGIVNASLEVVRRLEAAGHQVTYACPWDRTKDVVERQGIRYRRLAPVDFDPAPLPQRADGRYISVFRAWATAAERRQRGLAALRMDEFTQALKSLRPDLILADQELSEHILTAVSLDYPVALLSPFFAFWRTPELPPVNCGLTGASSRIEIELAWTKLRGKRTIERLWARLRTGATDRRSILCAYAAQIGYPTNNLQLTSWLPPFTFADLPLLQMTASELELPHDPPDHVRFVGPMVAADRREPELVSADEARLDRIVDDAKRARKPILYCSLSSKDPGDRSFVERLALAVSARPEWELIIALGGQIDASAVEASGSNVHAFGWLPQLRVLQHADCSINHGGIHSIHECLHFGVPMLVYSGGRYDQPGAAARVGFHGIGLVGDKDRAGPAEMCRDLQRVLGDPRIRARLNEMQRSIAAYRTEQRLEQAVESILAQSRKSG